MSILLWIALGLCGGLACGWFLRSRGRALLGDVAAGVVGAIIGGFIAAVLLGLDIADFDGTSTLVAAMGAALLILILHSLPSVDVFE
ncbi:MAG: GlsB/YeaQ/YmgE family stress response membrane protein [Chloroflexi bacterium]|nr:GlsB/YeaQ/YmgE family stress response membrane protein [Chloroflexota bacterium]